MSLVKVQGKVVHLGDIRQGTSANGNTWVARDVVVQDFSSTQKHVMFSVIGEDQVKLFFMGQMIEAICSFEARESKGRWYNSCRLTQLLADSKMPLDANIGNNPYGVPPQGTQNNTPLPPTQTDSPAPAQLMGDTDQLPF